jgi:hypothetical protein
MKTASLKEIKTELVTLPKEELLALCLHMVKYKKENKELINYLIFESHREQDYIIEIKGEIDDFFQQINTSSYYLIKKSVRKILRLTKKHIAYSKKKETEVELLIYFCNQLAQMHPSFKNNSALISLFERLLISIQKSVETLHEDLQYDFSKDLGILNNQIRLQ